MYEMLVKHSMKMTGLKVNNIHTFIHLLSIGYWKINTVMIVTCGDDVSTDTVTETI